jgi:uncharacterized protein
VVTRYDEVKLDAPKRTPQGGLRASAFLTRSGIFVYRKDGKTVREYRPPEEVFRADSLATLSGATVTKQHPAVRNGLVDPSSYRSVAVGHVGDEVKQDGDKVAGVVYVQDADAIAAVERGSMRQVSCGYQCRMDETPGVTADGQSYDRVQRDITYNHVALVPVGRAGADVALRLDADDNLIVNTQEPSMKVERIDGVEYEIGTDAHKAAVTRHDAAQKASKDERDKLEARVDAAEVENKRLKAELAEAPTKLAQAAQARASLESGARAVLGAEAKLDGLKDAEIRSLVVEKSSPEIKLDGKSDAYVEALYDLAVAAVAKDGAAHAAVRAAISSTSTSLRADADDDYPSPARARRQMIARNSGEPQA